MEGVYLPLRRARRFLKIVASVVLFAFLGLTLEPLALAAQLPSQQQVPKAAATPEEKLSRTIDDVNDRLHKLDRKLANKEDTEKEKTDVHEMRATLDGLDKEVLDDFARVGDRLHVQGVPQVILDRHEKAVEKYKAEMAKLKAGLDEVDRAKDDDERAAVVRKTEQQLNAARVKDVHPTIDPKNLPFRRPTGEPRKAKETKEEYQASLLFPRVQLASTVLNADLLSGAVIGLTPPTPADLLSNDDVQITPDIQALASQLGNNPVAIFNWVHDNIEFIPTYGSIQGSQLTLLSKRGNAFDTASLLLALLRASNVPAHYVYGTVQIPAAQVMNWVGGVNSPVAAQELLGQGGIPTAAVVSGGQITAFRLEQVWVEAYTDDYPSRGAVPKAGDGWVALDPSFKQYQITNGMDIKNNVPFDAQGLFSQISATATINTTEGSVQGIDNTVIQGAIDNYRAQLESYIASHKANATVGDVLGDKTIIPRNQQVLPTALPYRRIVTANKFSTLPSNLRHQIRIDVYASDLDKALDNPSLSYTQSLPTLAGKRVSFFYPGATPADQSVIDGAVNNGGTSLPAYLISVVPTIKVEGDVVASGYAATMGDKQILTVTVVTPWYTHPADYKVTAGDFQILALDPAGISPQQYDARIKAHDLMNGQEPDFTSEMFYQIGLAWWGEKYSLNRNVGDEMGVRSYQLPSHTLVGAPLTVRYFFGIPRSAYYASRVVDAKEDLVTVSDVNGDKESGRRYMLAIGRMGSFLEGNIFEQAFLMDPLQSISTISAWKIANDRGIPLYTITQANAAIALPQIATDADAKSTMANAIAAGMRVTVPKQDIAVGNFSGTGYFIEDPVTGGGAYEVSGGRSGGSSPAPQNVFPIPAVPASPIIGLMVGSSLRSAGMSLVAENGVIVGAVMPAADVAVAGAAALVLAAQILLAILIILLIIWGISHAIDTLYPRTYRRYRHYTNAVGAIVASQRIFETKGGTFGDGVYVADAALEDSLGVGCPPNALDIVTRFQIPKPGQEDPSKVTGWVDIAITRDNLYKMKREVNTAGQAEYIIWFPLIPSFDPRTNGLTPALYFGPLMPGIQFEYACGG